MRRQGRQRKHNNFIVFFMKIKFTEVYIRHLIATHIAGDFPENFHNVEQDVQFHHYTANSDCHTSEFYAEVDLPGVEINLKAHWGSITQLEFNNENLKAITNEIEKHVYLANRNNESYTLNFHNSNILEDPGQFRYNVLVSPKFKILFTVAVSNCVAISSQDVSLEIQCPLCEKNQKVKCSKNNWEGDDFKFKCQNCENIVVKRQHNLKSREVKNS